MKSLASYWNLFQIRLKTQHKKLSKIINKLKASTVVLNSKTQRQKRRKTNKPKLKLNLFKLVTKTLINSEMQGISFNLGEDVKLNPIQLNNSWSRDTVRDILWKNIADTSENTVTWNSLFDV